MKETKDCPDNVCFACAVVNDEVLDELYTFHKGKIEEACRYPNTTPLLHGSPYPSAHEDPCPNPCTHQGEEEGHFFVEAH